MVAAIKENRNMTGNFKVGRGKENVNECYLKKKNIL